MADKLVGILGALPEEISELTKKIKNLKKVKSSGHEFIIGTLSGSRIVLTLSGMGKVNAAMTAQRLISEFKVNAIVFSGVAGGINPTLKVGDILVANNTFQHDVGFSGKKFTAHPPGELPEIGIGKASDFRFKIHFSSKILKELKKVRVIKGHPKINIGTIATGDQFIANPKKKRELEKMGADAVEMEGAAVAQVGRINNVPVFLIRSISDQAGSKSHIDFKSFLPIVASNNAALVEALVKVIV